MFATEALMRRDNDQQPQLVERFPSCSVTLFCNIMLNAEERSRTADTRIFSPLLYHLSYLGAKDIVGFPHLSVKQNVSACSLGAAGTRQEAKVCQEYGVLVGKRQSANSSRRV